MQHLNIRLIFLNTRHLRMVEIREERSPEIQKNIYKFLTKKCNKLPIIKKGILRVNKWTKSVIIRTEMMKALF